MPKYLIYCDGSTRANGQTDAVGAWAYAIINGEYGTMITNEVQALASTYGIHVLDVKVKTFMLQYL